MMPSRLGLSCRVAVFGDTHPTSRDGLAPDHRSCFGQEWGRLIKQPDELGGVETQSAYVIVADADATYARAKEAGAEVILDIKDEDYGGRGFTCRDLEGHIWNFGTYDPW